MRSFNIQKINIIKKQNKLKIINQMVFKLDKDCINKEF